MLREKMKNKKGFTLIEIIVVIVILAVLMAVAVPSVMSYMNEGQKAKYETIARAALINTQTGVAEDISHDGKANEDNEVIKWVEGLDETTYKTDYVKYGTKKSYGSNIERLYIQKIELSGTKDSGDNDLVSVVYYIKLKNVTGYRKVEVTVNGKMTVATSNVAGVTPATKYTFTGV